MFCTYVLSFSRSIASIYTHIDLSVFGHNLPTTITFPGPPLSDRYKHRSGPISLYIDSVGSKIRVALKRRAFDPQRLSSSLSNLPLDLTSGRHKNDWDSCGVTRSRWVPQIGLEICSWHTNTCKQCEILQKNITDGYSVVFLSLLVLTIIAGFIKVLYNRRR